MTKVGIFFLCIPGKTVPKKTQQQKIFIRRKMSAAGKSATRHVLYRQFSLPAIFPRFSLLALPFKFPSLSGKGSDCASFVRPNCWLLRQFVLEDLALFLLNTRFKGKIRCSYLLNEFILCISNKKAFLLILITLFFFFFEKKGSLLTNYLQKNKEEIKPFSLIQQQTCQPNETGMLLFLLYSFFWFIHQQKQLQLNQNVINTHLSAKAFFRCDFFLLLHFRFVRWISVERG